MPASDSPEQARFCRRDLWAFLAALAGFLFVGIVQYHEVLTGTLVWDERFSEYIPWRVEAGRILASGEFPFFTPRVFGGMPLLSAAYNGVLYPPNWLYALFGPLLSNYLAILHTVLGGAGMMLYLSRSGVGRFAAFVGALFFITGTFGLIHEPHVSMREAALLAPLVAWAAIGVLEAASSRRMVLLAILFALHVAVGYWQITLFLLCWIFVDWCARVEKSRALLLATLRLGVALLAGVLLMGPQLIPTVYHVEQTPRAAMTLESWQEHGFPLSHWIIFAMPRALGTPLRGWSGDPAPGELLVTLSPVAWALAALGAIFILTRWKGARRKRAIALVVGFGVAMLLACGSDFPPNALLFHVPPFNAFRIPARWLFVATTFACILGAYSLDELINVKARRRTIFILFVWLGLVVLLSGLYLITTDSEQSVGGLLKSALLTRTWAVWHYAIIGGYLLALALPCRVTACALAVLLASTEYRLMEDGDLFPPGRHAVVLESGANPLLRDVLPEVVQRLYALYPGGTDPHGFLLPHNTALFTGYRMLSGYSPLLHAQLPQYLQIGQDGRGWREAEHLANPAALMQLGVSHLLIDGQGAAPELLEQYRDLEARGIYQTALIHDDRWVLTELPRTRPRFDFVRSWRAASDGAELNDWIWKEENLNGDVLVEELETAPGTTDAREVNSVEEGASWQRVTFDPTDTERLLVVRDVYWKGWKYRTRGAGDWSEWLACGRANGLLRAAAIPPGAGEVELRFRPPGFGAGLACGAAGLALLGGIAVMSRKRAKNKAF